MCGLSGRILSQTEATSEPSPPEETDVFVNSGTHIEVDTDERAPLARGCEGGKVSLKCADPKRPLSVDAGDRQDDNIARVGAWRTGRHRERNLGGTNRCNTEQDSRRGTSGVKPDCCHVFLLRR